MISMTGFGRGEAQGPAGRCVVELSSGNRKQREVLVNLPRRWQALESDLRIRLERELQRGRVQAKVSFERVTDSSDSGVQLDLARAKAFIEAGRQVDQISGAVTLGAGAVMRASEVLHLPGVLLEGECEPQESELARARSLALEALEKALEAWQGMRLEEGRTLGQDLSKRIRHLRELLALVVERSRGAVPRRRDALLGRLAELGLELDLSDERLLRELALFADRCDVSEEVIRLESHFAQFESLTAQSGEGRSLDFLMQEFLREWNTIGSKANDAKIAHAVVEAKAEVERIREQVQNLE